MLDAIIVGAGGHGAEIEDYIRAGARDRGGELLSVAGFIDDNRESYGRYLHRAPLLGDVSTHRARPEAVYVVGIADPETRKLIVERFAGKGARFACVIHKSACVSESAVIGEGVVIAPNVNVGPNVSVGAFCLLNARCSLGHDTRIGDFNVVSPNVSFSGSTTVGSENLFGVNAATIPGVTIGSRNKIAAGMVLDKSIGDDEVVFYRFRERVVATVRSV